MTLAVTANDTDADGAIDPATVDLDPDIPGRQTTVSVTGQGTFVADDAGNVTFTPEVGLTGFTGVATISYTVQDDQGAVSNPAAITVIVTGGGNQRPVAVDDQATTASNTPVTLSVTANDRDPDGTINPATVDLDPSLPGQQIAMRVPAQGIFNADAAGNVTFAPEAGFTGISTIAYTVMDDQGAPSNPASITITVTGAGVNQPPIAVADSISTAQNTPVTLSVTANDRDPDGAIDVATVDLDPARPGQQTTVSVPAQGTFAVDTVGNVTFTPAIGFTGTAAISYHVRDDRGDLSNSALISVTVNGGIGFNPPLGLKFVNPANLPELEWRLVWINNGNTTANAVRVTDNVPSGTLFVINSLTCEAQGSSTIDRCDFEAEANRVVYEGTIGADAGTLTEADAGNEVVITYRVTVVPLDFFGLVENQAFANWDADGSGTPDNEIATLQPPALSDDPTSPLPFDPTVVNIPPAPGACLFQVHPVLTRQEGEDIEPESVENPDEGAVGTRATRQVLLTAPALTTPLTPQTVAGSAVAVAAIQGPRAATTILPLVRVSVANGNPQILPDIIEDTGLKTQLIPPRQRQVVVTEQGVLVDIPENLLAQEDTLDLIAIEASEAPEPVPGELAAGLWQLQTLSGISQFDRPITLRLPYPDADQNGSVDGVFPAIDESELSLWQFDAVQGWIPLGGAIVIPSLNVVVAQTQRTGLLAILRATGGQVAILGDATNDVNLPSSTATLTDTSSSGGFEDIGIDITTPFVAAWDTTQISDGDYELRAVCVENPADLTAFQTTTLSGGGGSGSSCFIATAAYGTPWMPQVKVLRAFRDTYLLANAPGRWLVKHYYRLSPPMADHIRDRAWMRHLVRLGLTPVVWGVQTLMIVPAWMLIACVSLGAAGSLTIGRRRYRRRRHN